MAKLVDGVTFVSQPVYDFNHDFLTGPFEKRLTIPKFNSGVFIVYASRQVSSMLGEHLTVTVTQEEMNANYKVHVHVYDTYLDMALCTETVTNLHPTSKPIKLLHISDSCFMSCKLEFHHVPVIEPIKRSLADDLKAFLDGEPIVTLIGSDGEVLVAKFLLQLRSSALRAMFSHDMEENKTSTIDLKNFDTITLQAFCDFLWTDQVKQDSVTALGLYLLADKYDVQGLKKVTGEYMLVNLKDFDRNEVFEILTKTDTDQKLFEKLLIEKYAE